MQQDTATRKVPVSRTSSIITYVGVTASVLVVTLALAGFGLLSYEAIVSGPTAQPPVSATALKTDDMAGAALAGVFGTIQFSLSVLSGVIIVFAAIISFVVGRSAKQTQEATRIELNELASLYRENLAVVSSSISNNAKVAVDQYLNELDVQARLKEYQDFLQKISRDHALIEPIVQTYKDFQRANEELETDYVGPFLEISAEDDSNETNGDTEFDTISVRPAEFRSRLQQVLIGLIEGALLRRISSNTAFNGSQRAARHQFHELAHRLAVLAHWLDSSDMHDARVRRSEYERGDRYVVVKVEHAPGFALTSANPSNDEAEAQAIRSKAFAEILRICEQTPIYNSEFIYNEIWNISIVGNELRTLIDKFEEMAQRKEQSGQYVPSYLYAMLARAYSFDGAPNWREAVLKHLNTAILKHRLESPSSSWYMNTAQTVASISNRMRMNPFAENEALEGSFEAGDMPDPEVRN